MKPAHKRFLVAALLAGVGLASVAQTTPPVSGGPEAPLAAKPEPRGRFDPERMQARVERRLAKLKEALKLTPAQEGAWSAFTAAMKPTERPLRPDRAEFARLTTPERIDRMRELRTQRQATMDRRAEATKTFYATLSPGQKKAFDDTTLRALGGRHGMHGRHGHRYW